MSTASINVALLGTGIYAASDYVPALLSEETKHVNVSVVWSLDEVAAQGFADKLGPNGKTRVAVGTETLDAIFNDSNIDAIVMVLPFMAQPPLIRRAWQAGKHVLSEKPIERDVEFGAALIKEYQETWKPKGLIWRIAEDYDHEPIHKRAAKLLADPRIGPVLYWHLENQNYCEDGDKYQATSWRTIPAYQGGFLLDGGVHSAAMLRVILPFRPSSVVATAALHRNLFPPHDTVQALVLPDEEAITSPHGPFTKLVPQSNSTTQLPVGKSIPTGTITMTWAVPDIEHRSTDIHQILTVTCLNGRLTLINDSGTRHLEVQPAKGSDVEAVKETSVKKGVHVEIEWFANAVLAARSGRSIEPSEDFGRPEQALWDVAFIQSMLNSNGSKVVINETLSA